LATREERRALGRRRIVKILTSQTISNWRTIEHKIADAGPSPMRVDPHVLTEAKRALNEEGVIARLQEAGAPWFHLSNTPREALNRRLAQLTPVYRALQNRDLLLRLGQTMEIAVYKALLTQGQAFHVLGGFTDLNDHDDATLYSKEEPPSTISGLSCTGRMDFILASPEAGLAGVEVKNIREWLYPDRTEIRELLAKATDLDAIPVLIGRRIPFVTFKLLNACGAIVHQTYNQLFPASAADLAAQVRHKDLLGYHDVRTGNEPDRRLLSFVGHLPQLLINARPVYDEYQDLLANYASGDLEYHEFAARVRRRKAGTNEDHDWEDDDPMPPMEFDL
jgi:hypothetical protein